MIVFFPYIGWISIIPCINNLLGYPQRVQDGILMASILGFFVFEDSEPFDIIFSYMQSNHELLRSLVWLIWKQKDNQRSYINEDKLTEFIKDFWEANEFNQICLFLPKLLILYEKWPNTGICRIFEVSLSNDKSVEASFFQDAIIKHLDSNLKVAGSYFLEISKKIKFDFDIQKIKRIIEILASKDERVISAALKEIYIQ